MTTTEPRTHDDRDRTDGSASEQHPTEDYNKSVDAETRKKVLNKYDHRCQACGRRGPEQGGLATLQVHHIDRDPEGMAEHDIQNLTLLCRSCHSWLHQQSSPDDSPVEITEADQSVLLPQDIEILRYLESRGPTRTGDIAANLTADLTVPAVRQRLWVLMGLDNIVETREKQIVDKDIETGEWGLTEQIETSVRGHIPDDPQLLVQRMEDEQVRQALDRGVDRQDVTEVLGIARRTSFNKEKRARAYDFPLDAFSRGGRRTHRKGSGHSSGTSQPTANEDEKQQQLNKVAEQTSDSPEEVITWERSEPESDIRSPNRHDEQTGDSNEQENDGQLRGQLQRAIGALQKVDEAMSS